jgi:predicted phosphodiesterase
MGANNPVPVKELQRAVNAAAMYKSKQEAADSLGLPEATFRARVKKAVSQGITATCESYEAKASSMAQLTTQEVKRLRKENDALTKQIEKIRAARPLVIPKKGKVKLGGAASIRVILADTHGHHVDTCALSAVMSDLDQINVDEVVLLGDHLDCGGWLAQNHTLGYVAETEDTFEDDVEATNGFLDELQKRTKGAKTSYIEGNHEHRIEKFCVTSALRNNKDAAFLLKRIGPQYVLGLEKRGIRFIHRGTYYDGLPIPGSIQLGKCVFTHPTDAPKYASSTFLKKYGGNIVFGHTHRVDATIGFSVMAGTIGAWGVGCLCQRQPMWMHTNPTDWSHAYGLQLVGDDGDFLHITVPVINGVSYLQPLIAQLKG